MTREIPARIASFKAAGKIRYGYVTDDDGMVDLTDLLGTDYPTLQDAVVDGKLGTLVEAGKARKADFGPDEFTYEIPIAKPEKLICVGVNFPDRNAEYKDGKEAPKNMSLFIRFPRSFVGHDVPLTRPPESEQLDYEGEVTIVIGKGGRRIPEETALDHIAALTLCNEGTLRDWVRHAKFNVTQGKNFDGSGSIGPWLVPFTDPAQLADIALTTKVNGEIRQEDRTGRMMFSFSRIINYISTFTTLVPGDVIVCGTPTGAGARFDPPIWLKPGDVVEVAAEGIGTLRNGVVDEV